MLGNRHTSRELVLPWCITNKNSTKRQNERLIIQINVDGEILRKS